VGLFFARLQDPTGASSSDNGVPGFNALAGYRSFLTDDRRLALAVEYTYQRANLSFSNVLDPSLGLGSGLSGIYEAHGVTAGLSYHFQ
jgi:opacity protein-like surface antigen